MTNPRCLSHPQADQTQQPLATPQAHRPALDRMAALQPAQPATNSKHPEQHMVFPRPRHPSQRLVSPATPCPQPRYHPLVPTERAWTVNRYPSSPAQPRRALHPKSAARLTPSAPHNHIDPSPKSGCQRRTSRRAAHQSATRKRLRAMIAGVSSVAAQQSNRGLAVHLIRTQHGPRRRGQQGHVCLLLEGRGS